METIQKENSALIYEKPATKKHDAVNTVQGSYLYSDYYYKEVVLYYVYYYYY